MGEGRGGLEGLADRSHAPKAHPWRISAEVEAVIRDLRGSHRRWGPRLLGADPKRMEPSYGREIFDTYGQYAANPAEIAAHARPGRDRHAGAGRGARR